MTVLRDMRGGGVSRIGPLTSLPMVFGRVVLQNDLEANFLFCSLHFGFQITRRILILEAQLEDHVRQVVDTFDGAVASIAKEKACCVASSSCCCISQTDIYPVQNWSLEMP